MHTAIHTTLTKSSMKRLVCSEKIEDIHTLMGSLPETASNSPSISMNDTKEQERLGAVRYKTARLLKSAPHQKMHRVIERCGVESADSHENKCTLKTTACGTCAPFIQVIETVNDIDARTAATHALFYACWARDVELVRWILDDMREIIDIHMQLSGMGILEWSLIVASWLVDRVTLDHAGNIARLLITYYGSKLDPNRSQIMDNCIFGWYPDVIAYLVMKYKCDLNFGCNAHRIFECLADGQEDEAAKLYLNLHLANIIDPHECVFKSAAYWASASLFKLVIDRFRTEITPAIAGQLFHMLCHKNDVYDRRAKVEIALDTWDSILDPDVIEISLANCWDRIVTKRWGRIVAKRWDASENCGGLVGQAIVKKYIDKLPGQERGGSLSTEERMIPRVWQQTRRGPRYGTAMVVCYHPLNLELLGILIDKSLEDTDLVLEHLTHVLLECCDNEDIETFAFILERAGSCIYALALELWCEMGNLEAVTMLFEVGKTELMTHAPQAFVQACKQGDTELALLLIKLAGDSICESSYHDAFYPACRFGYVNVILMLAELWPCVQPNINSLHPARIERGIICWLNATFNSSLDPTKGRATPQTYQVTRRCVRYGGVTEVCYELGKA